MALFSAIFATAQLSKELSALGLRRYFSVSEIVCPRRSPLTFGQILTVRHQHTNSPKTEGTAQIHQVLDHFGKVRMPSQAVPMSQLQIQQLSDQLLQLALTATNLVRDLLHQKGTATQTQKRSEMEEPSVVDSRKAKNENGKTTANGSWVCVNCDYRNSILHFECQGCVEGRPTEHQRIAIRRILSGIWQCVKCKMLNGRRNSECFECGTKKFSGMANLRIKEKRTNLPGDGTTDKRRDGTRDNRFGQRMDKPNGAETHADEGTMVAAESSNTSQHQQQPQRSGAEDQHAKRQQLPPLMTDNGQMVGRNTLGTAFFEEGPTEGKQPMAD